MNTNLRLRIKQIIKEAIDKTIETNLTQKELLEIFKGYLQTALWTEHFDNRFSTEDIDQDSIIQAYTDVKTFIQNAGTAAVSEALEKNDVFQLGMDIWLTRNRHGAGFFDHSYDFENDLTSAAQNLGEVNLVLGDDNKLHFE